MKAVREKLRSLLESQGELRKLVIVYQRKGEKPKSLHSFRNTVEALAFVGEGLRLSKEDLVGILEGR